MAPAPRLSFFKVNFQELYERHLRRHSQYGINVNHLISVIGSYLALFALARSLMGAWWPVLAAALVVPYVVTLAVNIPARLLAVCVAVLGGFFTMMYYLPEIPYWASLGIFVVSHYFQNVGHKIWTLELDMTDFNKKYKKGAALSLLLALYELPILLNYLVFDWGRSALGVQHAPLK
jgi:hypothetical protein